MNIKTLLNICYSAILSYPKTSHFYVTSFRHNAAKVYPVKKKSARKRTDERMYDKELHLQDSTRWRSNERKSLGDRK